MKKIKIVEKIVNLFKKKPAAAPKAENSAVNKGPLYHYRTNKHS